MSSMSSLTIGVEEVGALTSLKLEGYCNTQLGDLEIWMADGPYVLWSFYAALGGLGLERSSASLQSSL